MLYRPSVRAGRGTMQWQLIAPVSLAAAVHAGWNALVKSSGDQFLTFATIHVTGAMLGAGAILFVSMSKPAVLPCLPLFLVVHNVYYVVLLVSYCLGNLSEVCPSARGILPLLVTGLAAL